MSGPVAAPGYPRCATRRPGPLLFSDYDQLLRFFYLFMFRDPAGFAGAVVAADQMAFIDRLWADSSPGYHLAHVKQSLRQRAAIGYYRAVGPGAPPKSQDGALYGRIVGSRPQARNLPSTCTGPATAESQQTGRAPGLSSHHPPA